MKNLVIIAHPNMKESKINSTWKERLKKERDVTVHDLYEVYGDGEINIQQEHDLLQRHDRIIFQFPFYWYSAPPLLKKWQDEVLTHGWAYGSIGNKLKGKEFFLAISAGGPKEAYEAGGYNNYTISEMTKPFQAMANLTEMRFLPSFVLYGARGLTIEAIDKSAENYILYINSMDFRR